MEQGLGKEQIYYHRTDIRKELVLKRLRELVTLKHISNGLATRVRRNYRSIVGINSALILLGVGGMIQPTTSALIHNTSTLAISMSSVKDLL